MLHTTVRDWLQTGSNMALPAGVLCVIDQIACHQGIAADCKLGYARWPSIGRSLVHLM